MHAPISDRWSARGYDPDATISADEAIEILEAGRWAPTWGRVQPVRFLVGLRGERSFDALAQTLTRGNMSWAPAAGMLVLLCTTNAPDDPTAHEYGGVDLGFAAAQMTIQAVSMGLNAHPMAGFDPRVARELFAIPADQRPLVMLSIGRLAADRTQLHDDIRARDEAPRTRLPLAQIAFAGRWGTPFTGA